MINIVCHYYGPLTLVKTYASFGLGHFFFCYFQFVFYDETIFLNQFYGIDCSHK